MTDSFDEPIERCIRLLENHLEGYALARVPHIQYLDRPDLEPTKVVATQLLKELVVILAEGVLDDNCNGE